MSSADDKVSSSPTQRITYPKVLLDRNHEVSFSPITVWWFVSIIGSVVIKQFTFCASSAGESGFGCAMVAVGEAAEESEINKESLIPIRFSGISFRETESDRYVSGGSALILEETGMYYVPS